MNSPPKAKRARPKSALRKLQVLRAYHIADFNAKIREDDYWFWESVRARLADLLDVEGNDE